MTGIWKLAVLTALLGVAGAIGAGVYWAVDDRHAQIPSEPILTESLVGRLAKTSVYLQMASATNIGFSIVDNHCEGTLDVSEYDPASGNWVVDIGDCSFIVNDHTGEVTGP